MMGWGMGPLAGPGMLIFWLLFVGLLVWVAFIITRAAFDPVGRRTDALMLERLRERMAGGQITPQEFEDLRHKLGV